MVVIEQSAVVALQMEREKNIPQMKMTEAQVTWVTAVLGLQLVAFV